MPKKKKETAAAINIRSKNFRARRLKAQRVKQDFIYRNLLQRFYEEHHIGAASWISLDEFQAKFFEPVVDKNTLAESLKHCPQIETSTAVLNGSVVSIIRVKYFLEQA
jgi:hypothetical protein